MKEKKNCSIFSLKTGTHQRARAFANKPNKTVPVFNTLLYSILYRFDIYSNFLSFMLFSSYEFCDRKISCFRHTINAILNIFIIAHTHVIFFYSFFFHVSHNHPTNKILLWRSYFTHITCIFICI